MRVRADSEVVMNTRSAVDPAAAAITLSDNARATHLYGDFSSASHFLPRDSASTAIEARPNAQHIDSSVFFSSLHKQDTEITRSMLTQACYRAGMREFLLHTCLPLLGTAARQRAAGTLEPGAQQFLVRQLCTLLQTEIEQLQQTARKPLVLLASMPGDHDYLGQLLIAAMLSAQGLSMQRMGADVSIESIVSTADEMNADAVALTFSPDWMSNAVDTALTELFRTLPGNVDIWLGGYAVSHIEHLPVNAYRFNSLEELPL